MTVLERLGLGRAAPRGRTTLVYPFVVNWRGDVHMLRGAHVARWLAANRFRRLPRLLSRDRLARS